MLMTSQIVASVIILGNVQPYKRKKTRQELFSEIVLMYVMYTMICFTGDYSLSLSFYVILELCMVFLLSELKQPGHFTSYWL